VRFLGWHCGHLSGAPCITGTAVAFINRAGGHDKNPSQGEQQQTNAVSDERFKDWRTFFVAGCTRHGMGGRAALPREEEQQHGRLGWTKVQTGSVMRHIFYLLSTVVAVLCSLVPAQSRAASDWQIFRVPEYGTKLEYPASIFSAVGPSETGVGQRFESDDGRAVLTIYVRENQDRDTPAGYLKKNLRQSGLDYERVTRSFFAISMEREGTIYYSRCNFSRSARGAIHCFDLVYPQAEKRAWDPVVTRISLTLRPLER
jgi:hypothetical protein